MHELFQLPVMAYIPQCCHAWSFEMINTNDIIGFVIHLIFFLICKIIVLYTWHAYVILIYEEIYLVIIFSTSYISYNYTLLFVKQQLIKQ